MATQSVISEADVLDSLVWPANGRMSPDVARAILEIRFDKSATKRIRQLLQKNNRGTISAEERILLGRFLRVGKIVDLLQAKARVFLQSGGQAG